MLFRKVRALRGPNIWANSPVIEAWVDLGPLKDTASNAVPGFNDRLKGWLPSMVEHECSEGHRGGFFVRLDEGTYPAHILEHVTLELQNLVGSPVGYGRARVTSEEGVYRVVFKYRDETLARACLETGRSLILAALEDRPFDIEEELRALRRLARSWAGPTAAVVQAAKERGIPSILLSGGSLAQLGYGARRSWIKASYTGRTGSVAASISEDKLLTKSMLAAVGAPAPEGRLVADAEDAWRAAQELGTPVAVKPRDADYGNGVALNLSTREQVVAAYEAARQLREEVLVERFVVGREHRLLVVGGRMVAAVRRDPPRVVGDGRSTVAQLVEETNRDPRRGEDYDSGKPLRMVSLDEAALAVLAQQGYTPDSVPESAQPVLIHRTAHYWLGGTTTDVTDQVHPEVAARVADSVRIVGLDVAGVDLVAQDIGRPLEEQGGAILEINAEPSLKMHLQPSFGQPQPVAEAIVDHLFAPGEDGRIPIVAVTGVNGKTTTTRLIGHIARGHWGTVGMTCTDGIYIGARRIEVGDCSGPRSARAILLNPTVEAAVFECARGGILREGLGFDKCAVAVVCNIGEGDHLGVDEIHTPEDIVKVKRVPVDVVLPTGYAVLNAADPLVARMAEYCRGGVIYFARDESEPVLAAHRASGGRAAFVRNGAIVLAEGPTEAALIDLADAPLTHGGQVGFQVENALAAAAACWGLGVPFATIRAGVASFESAPDRVPGRFNVLEHSGATVVVDFGHNPSALEALVESLEAFPGRRRTAVLSADGDRRDEVIVRQAEILAGAFDRVILYEEGVRMRGRAEGEVLELLRQGLAAGCRVSETREVQGEEPAIALALDELEPGDLLLVLLDAVETSLPFIQNRLARKVRGEPREALTAQR